MNEVAGIAAPRVPGDSFHRIGQTHVARLRGRLPGLLVVVAVACVATIAGHIVPVIGAPVFAIVAGIVIALFMPPTKRTQPGLTFSSKSILQGSIVILGTGLSFHQVLTTGSSSLPVLVGSLTVALVGAAVLGRVLHIDKDLRTLIGVGTGICGASAIAATDAVISASEADVSYAVATIFTFNVCAVLTFPTLGRLLCLSPHSFGLWSGTAINDLSSVVAASTIFGHSATSYAVVVKLTRTLMIVPISIGLALWRSRQNATHEAATKRVALISQLRHTLPVFIGWFLLAVTVNTLGLVPHTLHGPLSTTAGVMITMALTAIGLSTRPRDIRRAGLRPLGLGAILWLLVALASLGLQLATGTLS